jgi:hypothetical protein
VASEFREPVGARPRISWANDIATEDTAMKWQTILLSLGGAALAVPAGLWLTALAGVSFVRVHTEIEIDAPKEVVWEIITDFARYGEWNPVMLDLRTKAEPGARMDWRIDIGGRVRELDATMVRVRPGAELAWTGPVSSLPRVRFWGHHQLIIEERDAGRVRFVNTEGFGGVMSLVIGDFLQNDVRRTYEAHNAALKARAEAVSAQRAVTEER